MTTTSAYQLRDQLMPPKNPLKVIVNPVAWQSVFYCASSVFLGGFVAVISVLGVPFFPWIVDLTTQLERRRVVLLGLPALQESTSTEPGWHGLFNGGDNGGVGTWASTVAFAFLDTGPGLILSAMILGSGMGFINQVSSHTSVVWLVASLLWIYILLTFGLYVAWGLAAAQAYSVHKLLGPYSAVNRQVAELTSSRSELVDLFEAERRRIERDLHDGVQQHLVVSTMHLGEATYWLDQHQEAGARHALNAAHTSIEDALSSLRDTIRGIHPQVLTDRGLVAAIEELTTRQRIPVRLILHGRHRPLELGIESAAYYVTSESLTNISRHSAATEARVELDFDARRLAIRIRDNGHGGARLVPGHGVSGLAERTRTAGGTFELVSPPGGPTQISVTFPYHQAS